MSDENRLLILYALFLLLLLGLPPLTIWSGKVLGGMKGWKWVGLPLLLYINLFYVFFTAGAAQVALTDVLGWGDAPAGLMENVLQLLGFLCFLWGACTPAKQGSQNT